MTLTSAAVATGRQRIDAVDALRGIIMVVMVLDHTRDFVHAGGLTNDPTNLSQTTVMLFLTRWVTHYCAPLFVFLAGVSACLVKVRGRSTKELSWFLLTRGLWLIFLEVTVIRTLMWFNLDFSFLAMLQVIWAIGVSMVVLAALVHLPLPVIAGFGLVLIAGHNALDGVQLDSRLWMLLHQPGAFFPVFEGGPVVWVMYPIVPWVGVMAAGYAFGSIYRLDATQRVRLLVRLGLALIAAFVILRALNVYGDPSRWSVQSSAVFTVLSFVNTTKYPPSLLFLLMTIGPGMLALAWFEMHPLLRPSDSGGQAPWHVLGRAMVTFGRVPMFFYLWQWPLAHGSGLLLAVIAGKNVGYLFAHPPEVFTAAPPDYGFPLPVVYAAWIVNVLILFVLCRWYAGVKARRRDWWLSYL